MFSTRKTREIFYATVEATQANNSLSYDENLFMNHLAHGLDHSKTVRAAMAKGGRYLLMTDTEAGIDKRKTRVSRIVDRYWRLAWAHSRPLNMPDEKPAYVKNVGDKMSETWSRIADLSSVYIHRELTGDEANEPYAHIHSCMSHSDAILMYTENPDVVKVIGVRPIDDKNHRWVARALIWTLSDGKRFLDRIYPSDGCLAGTYLRQVAEKEGWIYRLTDSSGVYDRSVASEIEVTLDDVGHYPYMDTLIYVKRNLNGTLTLTPNTFDETTQNRKDGDWYEMQSEEDDPPWSPRKYCEHCDRYVADSMMEEEGICNQCREREYTFSDHGNLWVHNEDVVYTRDHGPVDVHYAAIDPVGEYHPISETVVLADTGIGDVNWNGGRRAPIEDTVNIDGEYYHLEADEEIIYKDDNGLWKVQDLEETE